MVKKQTHMSTVDMKTTPTIMIHNKMSARTLRSKSTKYKLLNKMVDKKVVTNIRTKTKMADWNKANIQTRKMRRKLVWTS